MKVSFWVIGKDNASYVSDGVSEFSKRIKRYTGFDYKVFPHIKKAAKIPVNDLKLKEAEMILNQISPSDHLILLDEAGKEFDSVKFSKQIENLQIRSIKQCIFLVGGAYGFHAKLYDRANQKISLSKMTYSHQLIRVIFLEQLYRAYTIMNNEPYHNV